MAAITSLPLKRLVVTNTLPQTHREPLCPDQQDQGFDIVDISTTIAESIRRTHNGESMCVAHTPVLGRLLARPPSLCTR